MPCPNDSTSSCPFPTPPSFAQPRSQSRETDRGKRVREGQNHLELHGNMNCKNASQDLKTKAELPEKSFPLSSLVRNTTENTHHAQTLNHLDTTAMYRLRKQFLLDQIIAKKKSRGRSVTGFLHIDGCGDEQNSTCSVCESGDGDKTGTKSAELDDARKQRKTELTELRSYGGGFSGSPFTLGFPFFPFTLFSCRRGKKKLASRSTPQAGNGKGYTRYMAR